MHRYLLYSTDCTLFITTVLLCDVGSVFDGNVALRGSGGAAASSGSFTLLSSLVRGNSGKSNAGGIAGLNGTISLVDVQLIDNSAGLDGTV
jgi:hypothetical protein